MHYIETMDGDFAGHPFRGNQYKRGVSSKAVNHSIRARLAERHGMSSKRHHSAAHKAHTLAASLSKKGSITKKYHLKMARFHGKRM